MFQGTAAITMAAIPAHMGHGSPLFVAAKEVGRGPARTAAVGVATATRVGGPEHERSLQLRPNVSAPSETEGGCHAGTAHVALAGAPTLAAEVAVATPRLTSGNRMAERAPLLRATAGDTHNPWQDNTHGAAGGEAGRPVASREGVMHHTITAYFHGQGHTYPLHRAARLSVVDPAPHEHGCMDCGARIACEGCGDAAELSMCDACLARLEAELSAGRRA